MTVPVILAFDWLNACAEKKEQYQRSHSE